MVPKNTVKFELFKLSYILELLITIIRNINSHHNENGFNLNIYKNIAGFKTFFANDFSVVHVRLYRSVPYTLVVPVIIVSPFLLS